MAFQGDSIYWVEVEKIVPNPFQPRREFDEERLKELAESVRMYGILQPLTVTRKEIQREDGTFYTEYELIAGERRLRASKLAGLTQVPVIIREGEDTEQEKLELAIIENLQREDLNAVDRAMAFRQLSEVFSLSHSQIAKKVGRSREYVSNTIRLLGLPDYILNTIKRGELSEGHARTLLMINDRPEELDVVFREILLKKLSVREVEKIVRKIATDKMRKQKPAEYDADLIEMEKKFMDTLGTRVEIQKTGYGGKILIDYFSIEDLEGMLSKMLEVKFDASKEVPEETDLLKILGYHTPLTASEPTGDVVGEALKPEDDSVKSESEAFEKMEVEEIYTRPAPPTPNVSYLSPSYFHPNRVATVEVATGEVETVTEEVKATETVDEHPMPEVKQGENYFQPVTPPIETQVSVDKVLSQMNDLGSDPVATATPVVTDPVLVSSTSVAWTPNITPEATNPTSVLPPPVSGYKEEVVPTMPVIEPIRIERDFPVAYTPAPVTERVVENMPVTMAPNNHVPSAIPATPTTVPSMLTSATPIEPSYPAPEVVSQAQSSTYPTASPQSVVPVVKKDDDDNNLYSLKNFSI